MTGRMPVALTAGRSQMWSLLNAAPRAKARAIRVSSSCLWSPGPSTPSWSKPNSPPLTTTSSAGPKARSSTSAPMPPVSHSHSQTHNSSFFSLCRFLKGQFTQKLKSCYNLLSCRSKPVCVSLFCLTQNNIFWRMLVTKQLMKKRNSLSSKHIF